MPISAQGGITILCETCWSQQTFAERMPYYERVWYDWQDDDFCPCGLATLRAAVRGDADSEPA